MDNESTRLSLGKCWQGHEPWLCFQATISSYDGEQTQRKRGYVVVDARRGHVPLHWQTDKPEGLMPSGGAANIIRKYLPTSYAAGVELGTPERPDQFVALMLQHGSEDTPDLQRFALTIHAQNPPEIELSDSAGTSYLRWSERGLYTVRKKTEEPAASLHKKQYDIASVHLLLKSWDGASQNPKSTADIDDKGTQTHLPLFQRQARDRCLRRLKTLNKTIKQDRAKVSSPEEVQILRRNARLLQSWMHLIKPDMHELTLSAEQANQDTPITIEIDPDRTPGENLNLMFHDLHRKERSLELGGKRLAKLFAQEQELNKIIEELRGSTPLSQSRCNELLARAGLAARAEGAGPTKGLGNSAQKNRPPTIGRLFTSSDGALIHLGRTAQENDLVTKAARSNDWWFHTSGGVQGAHVIVARRTLKQDALPPTTAREAAILAVHFSNLSMSRQGEVYVTTRGHLRKRKGMQDGLWNVERSQTMMIRYEESELAAIFTREIREGTLRRNDHPSA